MSDDNEPRLIRRRARYERNFTQIANSWLRDESLSYRARGILAAVWSHDDGWTIKLKDLAAASPKEGIDAVRAAVNELELVGYLRRVPKKGVGSQFLGHDWEISDPHDLGDTPLFTALDDPTRPVDNASTASDDPMRTALDNPTPIRTPLKTSKETTQSNHRASEEAQSARPHGSPSGLTPKSISEAHSARPSGSVFDLAASARKAAEVRNAARCPGQRGERPHIFELSGYCRSCGTRRPGEGDASPVVVNTTTGEVQ